MSAEQLDIDGDWVSAPWFLELDSFSEEWHALGLTRERRRLAADALARLFPPEHCFQTRDDPKYQPTAKLFGYIRLPGAVASLLKLGLDAAVTQPWEEPELLNRLRLRRSHHDAAFEVHVHAGLVRAGNNVERIPTTSERRPDLRVLSSGVRYELELKRPNEPNLDVVAGKLSRRLGLENLITPGFHLLLAGSESLTERALANSGQVEAEIEEIARAYRAAAATARIARAPGRFAAASYGEIIVTAQEGLGSYSDRTLPDLPEAKKASRVLRNITDAVGQLSGTCAGVIVVGTYHAAFPFLVERLVQDAALKNELFKRCRMVVLCEAFPDAEPSGSLVPMAPAVYAFAARPKFVRLNLRDRALAVAAASTYASEATMLRPATGQTNALTMDTRRPKLNAVSLGSASLKAGQTAVFRFGADGPIGNPVVSDVPAK